MDDLCTFPGVVPGDHCDWPLCHAHVINGKISTGRWVAGQMTASWLSIGGPVSMGRAAVDRGEGDSAVAGNGDTPGGRGSLGTDRLAAFSDGVLAIAATLLVLEIMVQPPGTLLQQVLDAWPGFVAYVVSFLTIGGTWLVHTALTDRLTRADPIFLQLNLVLLLVVAFLPFPTKLVINALHITGNERVAITIYGLTLLAIRLLTVALDAYARREHLYSP
jgi:uncharacterized membrane protein